MYYFIFQKIKKEQKYEDVILCRLFCRDVYSNWLSK